MSFICQVGDHVVPNRVPCTKIVVETRGKVYTNKVIREDEDGNISKEIVTSKGHETVKEINVCPECASKVEREEENVKS